MTETIKIENTLIELHDMGGYWEIRLAGEPWLGANQAFGSLADARQWVDLWITSGDYARGMYFITGHGAEQRLRTTREALREVEGRLARALAEAQGCIKALADDWTDENLQVGRHVLYRLDEATDAHERAVSAIAAIERRLAYAEKAATERPALTLRQKVDKLSKAAKSALIDGPHARRPVRTTDDTDAELRDAGFLGPNGGLTDSGINARKLLIDELLDALL